MSDHKAIELRDIWNKLLLNKSIEVCTDRLQGVGFLEIKLLKLVYFNQGFKIKDYLEKLGTPKSTLSNVVNRLVSKGLIDRKIDQTDSRSFGLELTTTGKEAIEEHLNAETGIFEGMLELLNEDERREFVKILDKISKG